MKTMSRMDPGKNRQNYLPLATSRILTLVHNYGPNGSHRLWAIVKQNLTLWIKIEYHRDGFNGLYKGVWNTSYLLQIWAKLGTHRSDPAHNLWVKDFKFFLRTGNFKYSILTIIGVLIWCTNSYNIYLLSIIMYSCLRYQPNLQRIERSCCYSLWSA